MAQATPNGFVCSANFSMVSFCKEGPKYEEQAFPSAVFGGLSLVALAIWIAYAAWEFGFLEGTGAAGQVDPRSDVGLDENVNAQRVSKPTMGLLLEFQNPEHEREFREWIFPLHRGHLLFAFATALPGFPLLFVLIVTLVSSLGKLIHTCSCTYTFQKLTDGTNLPHHPLANAEISGFEFWGFSLLPIMSLSCIAAHRALKLAEDSEAFALIINGSLLVFHFVILLASVLAASVGRSNGWGGPWVGRVVLLAEAICKFQANGAK